MWNVHPKVGEEQGLLFRGEGTVVNPSVNLLPKPLPILIDWILLLEMHQIKWVYITEPPGSELSAALKKQTKHKKKNGNFSCCSVCLLSWTQNQQAVASTQAVCPLNNASLPTEVCRIYPLFLFSEGAGLCWPYAPISTGLVHQLGATPSTLI